MIHNLSDDGSRVFFMTREALTANDQPAVDSYGQPNYDIYMHENGKTRMTVDCLYPSMEVRDMVLKTGMDKGAATSYDRLEEVARELQGA